MVLLLSNFNKRVSCSDQLTILNVNTPKRIWNYKLNMKMDDTTVTYTTYILINMGLHTRKKKKIVKEK